MLPFPCLPKAVSHELRGLRPMFRHRQHLGFCWLWVCQAIDQEKATDNGLARLAPRQIAQWPLSRLLTAGSWSARLLVWWDADQGLATVPPPDDGMYELSVDRTLKSQPGPRQTVAKKYRLNADGPYLFGLHRVVAGSTGALTAST